MLSHVLVLPEKTKVINDIRVPLTNSFLKAVSWHEIRGHNGIILNSDKFVLGHNKFDVRLWVAEAEVPRYNKQFSHTDKHNEHTIPI